MRGTPCDIGATQMSSVIVQSSSETRVEKRERNVKSKDLTLNLDPLWL